MEAPQSEIPAAYLERLSKMLEPADARAVYQAIVKPRPLAIRMTDREHAPDQVRASLIRAGFEIEAVPWMPEALLLSPPDRRRVQETELHQAGGIFIQSLSSMAAVQVLGVEPGHDVLDCCAAPGAKTSLIHWRQQGRGILVANDLSRRRLMKLRQIFDQLNVSGVVLQMQPAETLGGSHARCFDRVLLDAPCSGEGRFRLAAPSTMSDWCLGKIRRLSKLQQRLLVSAIQTLRSEGELVYATCTLAPEENELVVVRALQRSRVEVEILPIDLDCSARRSGLRQWEGIDLPDSTRHMVRIIPEAGMTPFFMARLRRC